MSDGYLKVDGGEIYYEEAGSGEPVVLIHAGVAHSGMWDDQFEALAQTYRAVRYDMRGYGRSELPAQGFSHLDDLTSLLDGLKISNAALVGCSLGGSVALDFALAQPSHVSNLVLIGAGVSGAEIDVEPPPLWNDIVAAWKAGDVERTSELETELWVVGRGRSAEDVSRSVQRRIYEMNLVALQNEKTAKAKAQPPAIKAAGRLGAVACPTLVIVGDLDQPDVVETAQILAREIPHAKLVTMTGTAHFPNMEQPEKFNRLLLDFLG